MFVRVVHMAIIKIHITNYPFCLCRIIRRLGHILDLRYASLTEDGNVFAK